MVAFDLHFTIGNQFEGTVDKKLLHIRFHARIYQAEFGFGKQIKRLFKFVCRLITTAEETQTELPI